MRFLLTDRGLGTPDPVSPPQAATAHQKILCFKKSSALWKYFHNGQLEPFGSDAEISRKRTAADARDDPLGGVVWLPFHLSTRGSVMDRRMFIGRVAGGLLTWPLAAGAQKPAMPVIGFLCSASPSQWASYVAAFRKGLNETGYVEGQNLAIEFHWAQGQYDRLPALAADLVRRQVAILVATGGPDSALAAKAATAAIPIVFTLGADPVALGFVSSLGHPGGNATGVSIVTVELVAKRLGLLHELVPKATVIAYIVNPNGLNAAAETRRAQEAAHSFGQQLHVLRAGDEKEIDAAFASLAQLRAGALLVGTD